jgi:hypothetical protein
MTGYDRRGHLLPPSGHGLWTPVLDVDYAGAAPLSGDALVVRFAGLSFPLFGAPGHKGLLVHLADQARNSGTKARPLGRDKIQRALTELKAKGYYAVRQTSFGRRPGNKTPEFATVRAYSIEPGAASKALSALTADEVVWHFRKTRAAEARLARHRQVPSSTSRLNQAG